MTPEQYHLLSLGRDPYEGSRTDDGKSRYVGGDVKVLGPKPTSDVDTWSLDPIKEMGQGVAFDMYRMAEAMNPAPYTGFAEGKPSAIGDLYNLGKGLLTDPAGTVSAVLESMNPSSHGGMTNLAMMPFSIKGAPTSRGLRKTEAMNSPDKETGPIGFSDDIEGIKVMAEAEAPFTSMSGSSDRPMAPDELANFIKSRRKEGVDLLREGMPLPLYNVHGTKDSAFTEPREDMFRANRDLSTDGVSLAMDHHSVLPRKRNERGDTERLGSVQATDLTPKLTNVVEEPLLGLFGELSRQGHLPISSNYYGPQRKGVYYVDEKYVKEVEDAFLEVDNAGFDPRAQVRKMKILQAIDERVQRDTLGQETAVRFARHRDDPFYHPWHPIEDSRIDVGFEEKGLLDKWIESEGDIDNITFAKQHFGYPYSEVLTTKGLRPDGFPLFSQNQDLISGAGIERQTYKITDPRGQYLDVTAYDREAPLHATGIPKTNYIEEMLGAYNPEVHDLLTNIFSVNTQLGSMSDLSGMRGLSGRSMPMQGLMSWYRGEAKKGNPPAMSASLANPTLAYHLGDQFRGLLDRTDISPERAALAGKGVTMSGIPVTSLPNKATYNLFGGKRAHDTHPSPEVADKVIEEMMYITKTGKTNYKDGVRQPNPSPVSAQQVERTQLALDAMEASRRPNVFSRAYEARRYEEAKPPAQRQLESSRRQLIENNTSARDVPLSDAAEHFNRYFESRNSYPSQSQSERLMDLYERVQQLEHPPRFGTMLQFLEHNGPQELIDGLEGMLSDSRNRPRPNPIEPATPSGIEAPDARRLEILRRIANLTDDDISRIREMEQ